MEMQSEIIFAICKKFCLYLAGGFIWIYFNCINLIIKFVNTQAFDTLIYTSNFEKIPIISNGGWQHANCLHVKFSNTIKKFVLLGKAIWAKYDFQF